MSIQTEPCKFKVGSSFGDIPQADHTKTTYLGATVLDGYVEFFFKLLHADNKSSGGNFDVSDMLVSVEDPLHVTINKHANMKASKLNIHKDLMKLLNSLLKTRYGEAGNRPAYVDDFISRIQDLSPESDVEAAAWEIQLWVIRHHPLLIELAKRRLLLQDFCSFYRALDHTAAEQLLRKINKFCRPMWHALTAPKDKFISAIYLKNHQRDYTLDPNLHEDGYLAEFLLNFIVHAPEEELVCIMFFQVLPKYQSIIIIYSACGIELEELELIVAHYFGKLLPAFLEEMSSATDKHRISRRYFGKLLPAFLEEMSSATDKHRMLKEILTMYAERRSISRRALG